MDRGRTDRGPGEWMDADEEGVKVGRMQGEGRREDASIYLGRRTALVDGSAGTARSAVLVKASLSQM